MFRRAAARTPGIFSRPRHTQLTAAKALLQPNPLVSIIMTSFNSEQWIARAVASALSQTWDRIELIVVDDSSTDTTVRHLRRFEKEDPRVKLRLLERNVGTYVAKNLGMSLARGDAITFMDSDDTSSPERVAEQLSLLRRDGLVATTCNYVRRTLDGSLVMNNGLRERQSLISLMIKREVIADIGWFDQVRTSADDEFFERIRFTFGRAAHANVPLPLYEALHRNQSLSTSGAAANNMQGNCEDSLLSGPRARYVQSYRNWYETLRKSDARPFIPFPMGTSRPFFAPDEVLRGH